MTTDKEPDKVPDKERLFIGIIALIGLIICIWYWLNHLDKAF